MQGANPEHDLQEGDLNDLVSEITWGEMCLNLLVTHRNSIWRLNGPGVSGRGDVQCVTRECGGCLWE